MFLIKSCISLVKTCRCVLEAFWNNFVSLKSVYSFTVGADTMILSCATATRTKKPLPDTSTLSSDLCFLFLCMLSSLLLSSCFSFHYNPHSKVLGLDTNRFVSLVGCLVFALNV